jgi:hypothetical protein
MASFRPKKIEPFAIEAKLNRLFGAKVYDIVFFGLEVLEVVDDELRAWPPSEHYAAVVDLQYSEKVTRIALRAIHPPE